VLNQIESFLESSLESILTTSEALVLEEGISIIFTVSLGSSITIFSSALSSTAQASRASLSSESKGAPGNLCLATSRKVLGNDSDAASRKAGLFFLCSCSSSIDLINLSVTSLLVEAFIRVSYSGLLTLGSFSRSLSLFS